MLQKMSHTGQVFMDNGPIHFNWEQYKDQDRYTVRVRHLRLHKLHHQDPIQMCHPGNRQTFSVKMPLRNLTLGQKRGKRHQYGESATEGVWMIFYFK